MIRVVRIVVAALAGVAGAFLATIAAGVVVLAAGSSDADPIIRALEGLATTAGLVLGFWVVMHLWKVEPTKRATPSVPPDQWGAGRP